MTELERLKIAAFDKLDEIALQQRKLQQMQQEYQGMVNKVKQMEFENRGNGKDIIDDTSLKKEAHPKGGKGFKDLITGNNKAQ